MDANAVCVASFPAVEATMRTDSEFPWPPEHRRNLIRKSSYRFAALIWGSRGDVQPFVALGAELIRRGHRMILAAREPYRRLAESHGIEFYPMAEDGTEELMQSLAAARGLPQLIRISASYSRSLIRPQFQSFGEAIRGADVILTKAVSTDPALHLAEKRGLPLFFVHIDPGFIPSQIFCLEGDRFKNRGGTINRFAGRMMLTLFGLLVADPVNAWRKEQRMPIDRLARRHWPSRLFRFPTFAAWSPHFLERSPDWPEWYVQTGWWRLPDATEVRPRLHDFLRSGRPPVYFGFGSWDIHEKKPVTDAILDALRDTGNRGILLRNTVDDREDFPESVLVEDDLPHDWLFPQMKAVVHHGGAGTTGSAAAAGIPSIIIPAFAAQASWGHLIEEKKIGRLLNRDALRADRLADVLREVDRPEIRDRAKAMGAKVAVDGGVRQAADEIERRLEEAVRKPDDQPILRPMKPPSEYFQKQSIRDLPRQDSPEAVPGRDSPRNTEWLHRRTTSASPGRKD
jgi:sterol 3beta-glucosyltransferase